MKHAPFALILAAALPTAACAAEGVSYDYVEAGYLRTESEFPSPLPDRRMDGWALNGAYAFHPNVHVFGGYSRQKLDAVTHRLLPRVDERLVRSPGGDYDKWRLGVGYRRELSERVDLIASLAYEHLSADFSEATPRPPNIKSKIGQLEAGVRGALAPNWEGYAVIGHQRSHTLGRSRSSSYARIGTLVKFNPRWGIAADARFSDDGRVDSREYFIGPRLSF